MAKTLVIYNDTCPICSREVAVYQKEAEACGLDIRFSGLSRDTLAANGLDRDAAAKRFHVIRDGEVLSGVDAFFALWRALPRWAWLARLLDRPGLRTIARVVYDRVLAPLLFAMDKRRRARTSRL